LSAGVLTRPLEEYLEGKRRKVALHKDALTGVCDDVDLERDRELVERSQAGDAAAFGNLYARYYERLLRVCMRRLGDRHEAEDATQEAFARAWKALPRFAGDKRFYPWLTVIAGNICTDVLRGRSRSTPTDDAELVGAVVGDTSEDLVLAAVDGELVNRALGRLSVRHRHVLAMREGSGWTYQQIADHEGVGIGTVETLLWRARRALRREFAALAESKGALAGFLVATGSLFRRVLFRVAHRGAGMQQQSGASGGVGIRNALAGVAVAGAAVAAAFVAPHALRGNDNSAAAEATAVGARIAPPPTTLAPGSVGSGARAPSVTSAGGSDEGSLPPGDAGSAASGAADAHGGAADPAGVAGGLGGTLNGALGGDPAGGGGTAALGGVVDQATGGLSGAVNNLGTTLNGVSDGVGGAVEGVTGALGGAVNGVTGGLDGAVNGVTGAVDGTVNGVTGAVDGTLNGVGQGAPGLLGGGSSGSGSSGETSTTTTLPNVGDTLGGLLGA
jgi:RNA polymerase sigma factor (sigma-70 family)